MLDKGTFCNSPAGDILVQELNKEEPKVQKRVSKLLTNYNTNLQALVDLDSRIAIKIALILHDDVLRKTDVCPDRFRTYLKNVIKLRHRTFLNKLNAMKPYKNRSDYQLKKH